MLTLSPLKILVVVLVAVILLGPDKLPQFARQVGAAWRAFRRFHERMEQEVRQNLPDLPSTADIARITRSPVALLNQLADMPAKHLEAPVADPGAPGLPASPGAVGNGRSDDPVADPGAVDAVVDRAADDPATPARPPAGMPGVPAATGDRAVTEPLSSRAAISTQGISFEESWAPGDPAMN